MSGPAVRSTVVGLAAVLVTAGAPGPARSQDVSPKKLEGVESRLEQQKKRQEELDRKSKALAREVEELRQKLISAAKTIQDHEAQVSALEARLHDLATEEARKRKDLDRQHGRLTNALAALERLSVYPTAAVIAAPGTPNDTVRTALLLRAVVPQLEGRAKSLEGELAQLASLRKKTSGERRTLSGATAKLDAEQERLQALIDRKRALVARTESEKKAATARAADLRRKAGTLRELLARLEKEQITAPPTSPGASTRFRKPSDIRPFSQAKGKLQMPVNGSIVRYFGQENNFDRSSRGIVIQSRPGAQVIAPFDGKVVFAGPFRGYGQILIIEHGERYHTLLAGFSRIEVVPDQWLLAGEPVGVVGRSSNGNPTLYMELRKQGRPINPLPWMTARK